METTNVLATRSNAQALIDLVTNALTSPNSQRAYGRALEDFMIWYESAGRPGFTKSTVNDYRDYLLRGDPATNREPAKPATVNLALSAIRKLAAEAADNGYLDPVIAAGIAKAKGVKAQGTRSGNWLNKRQAEALVTAPDVSTLKGARDHAILAVMIGAGLRRSEVAALEFTHIQQREGRWVIVDLVGKGNRMRTVPIPSWAKVAVDTWAAAAGINAGRVFRSIQRDRISHGDSMTPQAVYDVVSEYASSLGLKVAAHDLRRTFAKLAHKGGAGLDQIQLTLGHASIKTTERYLNVDQNLTDAPCDVLGLDISGD